MHLFGTVYIRCLSFEIDAVVGLAFLLVVHIIGVRCIRHGVALRAVLVVSAENERVVDQREVCGNRLDVNCTVRHIRLILEVVGVDQLELARIGVVPILISHNEELVSV